MGLDTNYNCFHGTYGRFNDWRREMFKLDGAEKYGVDTLDEMCGYGGEIPWNYDDPLTFLFNHSDCDGDIKRWQCVPIADRLADVAKKMPVEWLSVTKRFERGLREADKNGDDVIFG